MTAALTVLGALVLVHGLNAVVGLGLGEDLVVWTYNGVVAVSALICLARAALVPAERLAWGLLGAGLLAWCGGELYWSAVLADLENPPVPSPADALYLCFYPAAFANLWIVTRARLELRLGLWIDGAIGAFAVSALAAALLLSPILDATEGEGLALAVNLAYPVADLALLGCIVGVLGLTGWRPDRTLLVLAGALIAAVAADGAYLYQTALGTFREGTLVDTAWAVFALLIAAAAWGPAPRAGAAERAEGWRGLLLPCLFVLAALTLLVVGHFERTNVPALTLAAATVVAGVMRMALGYGHNLDLLARSRREASTDSLTGLGNRRRLLADLERAARQATPENAFELAIFDLDGFKHYNDTFGHLAGDSLLRLLGGRLAAAAGERGTAYRLGGDEFCILAAADPETGSIHTGAAAALSESGEGFAVGSSYGIASLPFEAQEPTQALMLADRRLYQQKARRGAGVRRQTRDVLLGVLRERQPDLHEHLEEVAEMAVPVGRRLGMSAEDLDELARAAEFHDVGKIGIPEAILQKVTPLTQEEWNFMRRHTIIGERILNSAPALAPVARIVRSTHERWDGQGYPDGLTAEDIPLAARIVFVCDAFNAMTSCRSYRAGMDAESALAELRRHAGTQFDPSVVDAFAAVLAEAGDARAEPSGTPAASA